MNKLDKVKEVVRAHYHDAACGIFDCRNFVGDPMHTFVLNMRSTNMGAMNELYIELEEIKDRIALMVYQENQADRQDLACDICDRISHMVTGFLASHTLYLVKDNQK